MNVFDQLGCEIINPSNNNSSLLLIDSILEPIKKIKRLEIIVGDIGLFKILIDGLDLPERWKLRLVRHFSRREYFIDLLKRLETNYDLDQETIDVDTKRLQDLIKIDQSKIIGGRTVAEIVKRFKKN
uniref:hypothetical protein n=1 Tax=Pelagibacter sp. (strain IMCC9063) TaxID=1002672 RepID=UPI001F1FE056|nr:hypothetical protein [Candidatus Pelagibacter sp. IMCC9063]